jgi:type IV pilus assembly protein PilV
MSRFSLKTAQLGVGLPEVMVSMLLLGVAVIGFAALQVRALATTNSAMYRTQAASIAQELGERMRMNPAGRATYKDEWDATKVDANKCESASCTPENMAFYDMRTITKLAKDTLPNGQVAVLPCVAGTNLCVYVAWNQTTATKGTVAPHCASGIDDAYVEGADCIRLGAAL